MAHFVDFGETADIFRPSLKTIFNGFNLDDELTDENGSFMTLSVSGRNDSEYDIITHEVPGLDGAIEEGNPTLNPRIISVRFRIKADTSTQLQRKFEKLRSLLEGSKKELSFTDDEFFFYATNQTLEVPDETSNSLTSVITFLCSDPYKYGPEKVLGFPSDLVMVNNEGTAEAFPVYEMTVLTPITFAMIQNHLEESILIGQPADDDAETIDQKELVYQDSGEKLNEWTEGAIKIDDINHQIVAGKMGTDGTGFIATNYGSHNLGHGPSINRELPETIQDFEVETIFETRHNSPLENFRTEVYMFDENTNMLGKLGINDNSAHLYVRRGHGRIGEVVGASSPRYVISAHDYEYTGRDLTQFYMRMTRIGNRFTFYIAQINNVGKHTKVMNRSVTLSDTNYLGKLKFIQLYIRTLNNRPLTLARINFVRVYKINTVTVDQTPYIAYPGDIITFDTQSEEILINGEDAMIHKDFISEFFSLKKGYNTIGVLPENSLDTTVRFRERRK